MMAPPTACSTPACGGMAVIGGKCANCATPVAEIKIDAHDYHREWKKLYQCKRWRDLRAAILRREPICVICKHNASSVADHIKDHRGNTVLFYDAKNLQGICKPCHDDKTGSTHGGGKRKPPVQPALVNGCVRDYALENR